jgi:pyruvate formate lyase activating enzyme
MEDMPTDNAIIFDCKRDCSEDGPGIRSTVFFKGCPLSCVWCHNPEGQDPQPALFFDVALCRPAECGWACLSKCENNSIQKDNESISVERESCTSCMACCQVCPSGALTLVGRKVSLKELLYELLIDQPFYQSSGGGVTLSGGEATMQMAFASRLLQSLKSHDIHTTLETCGFFSYSRFQSEMLPYLDRIYFDFKLIDDYQSCKYTGQSNRMILENFTRLLQEENVTVLPRIPLVPGITATHANLSGLAEYLRKRQIETCFLMPYNPLWQDKIARLGKQSSYDNARFMSTEELATCVEYFNS